MSGIGDGTLVLGREVVLPGSTESVIVWDPSAEQNPALVETVRRLTVEYYLRHGWPYSKAENR